jgi:hypothetical protein
VIVGDQKDRRRVPGLAAQRLDLRLERRLLPDAITRSRSFIIDRVVRFAAQGIGVVRTDPSMYVVSKNADLVPTECR